MALDKHIQEMLSDGTRIAALVPTPAMVAFLPMFLKPFQVRWLLNTTDKELSIIRELHPELVARRNRGGQFVYSREALFKYANISVVNDENSNIIHS